MFFSTAKSLGKPERLYQLYLAYLVFVVTCIYESSLRTTDDGNPRLPFLFYHIMLYLITNFHGAPGI